MSDNEATGETAGNIQDVRSALTAACAKAGGQRTYAREHRLSSAYISQVITGKIKPGPKILRLLGLQRRITYHPTDPAP